jgi:RNA polymerase sigma-70 factor (ECF subfamily)
MSTAVADMNSLAELMKLHRPRLLAMVQRRLDPALAARIDPDDILNDAFLKANDHWDWFQQQPDFPPYPWLYRLVLDCLIENWRRHHRGQRDVKREMPLPEASSIRMGLGLISPGTSPSAAVLRRELEQQMKDALSLLKEADRQILWMRHYDDLSFGEAALVLVITENAATVRYVRALRRLRKLWQQLHPEPGTME